MPNLQVVKQKVAAADAAQGTGGLMTRKVDAAVKVMLTKKVNPNQIWQNLQLVDKSGSMGNEYRKGHVQEAVERALGFAVLVDDDGSVPTCFFSSSLYTTEVKLDNFHGLIERERISAGGSTDLTAALQWAAKETGNGDLFSGGLLRRGGSAPSVKKMDTPAFVTIVTDGRPDNTQTAIDAVQRLSYRGCFLKFLYVGEDNLGWQFLESLDNDIPVGVPYEKGGRLIDNVNAQKMASLGHDDSVFYNAMLEEVNSWLAAAKQQGLI
ncbi:MAG TPA: VWA domain-containing protein [Candidatus Saccharimonadales bacterium]|nr:VWA domain-containing protein [Candidatus Saccharimonadales bacterium]